MVNKEDNHIEDIILFTLESNDYLHEFRIQRIFYLYEIIWYKSKDERLSNFQYSFYKKGIYSSDLREFLRDMNRNNTIDKFSEPQDETDIYYSRRIESSEVPFIISSCLDSTKDKSAEELISWSKKTVNLEYGETIEFDELDGDRLLKSISDYFPSLISLVE